MWKDPCSTQNQTSDSHCTKTDSIPWPSPRNSRHQDNPGDPDDGSSSDETYLPSSTRYSNTESDITNSESRDRSSRTMPHRHLDDDYRSSQRQTKSPMVLQGSRDHYSPVHRETTRPPHDEEFNNEEHYEADILLRYHTLICDCVGQEREVIPDIKNIRVSPPERYAGDDDIKMFETWLTGLLQWFRVYNVTEGIIKILCE